MVFCFACCAYVAKASGGAALLFGAGDAVRQLAAAPPQLAAPAPADVEGGEGGEGGEGSGGEGEDAGAGGGGRGCHDAVRRGLAVGAVVDLSRTIRAFAAGSGAGAAAGAVCLWAFGAGATPSLAAGVGAGRALGAGAAVCLLWSPLYFVTAQGLEGCVARELPSAFLGVLGCSAALYIPASLLGAGGAKLTVLALGCEASAFLLAAFSGKYARFQSQKTLRHPTPCVRTTHAVLVVAGAAAGTMLCVTVAAAPFIEPLVGPGIESLLVAGTLTTATLYCCMLGAENAIESEEVEAHRGQLPDTAETQQVRITRSLLSLGGLPYGMCGGMLPHKAKLVLAGFGIFCIASAIGMYRDEWEAFYRAEEAAEGRAGAAAPPQAHQQDGTEEAAP